jgi:hypothetical protein
MGEIIQIVTCNNYDGFQLLSFIFPQILFFFQRLLSDETNLSVNY